MNDHLITALGNWHRLNKVLNDLGENDVFDMLAYEMMTKRRVDMVTRLHQRANALRVSRERDELVRSISGVQA